jgi:hypothetical protein
MGKEEMSKRPVTFPSHGYWTSSRFLGYGTFELGFALF